MKKIIFCIILQLLFINFGKAQSKAVAKITLPAKQVVLFTPQLPATSFNHKNFINTATVKAQLLFFNDVPLLKVAGTQKKQLMLLTRLSFADVLETTVNSFKPRLVNTYDDNIDELFKDAPSWLQLTCIVSL